MRNRSKNRTPLYYKTAFNALVAGLVLGFGSLAFSGQDAELDISINAATLTTDAEELGATTERGTLESIFRLQKALVYDILRLAGIDPYKLSPAIKAAIDKPQTTNLEAFVAFSQSLDLLDQGRYTEAQLGFQRAAEIDPQFEMAARFRDSTPLSSQRVVDIAEASIKQVQQTEAAVTSVAAGTSSGDSKGAGSESASGGGSKPATGDSPKVSVGGSDKDPDSKSVLADELKVAPKEGSEDSAGDASGNNEGSSEPEEAGPGFVKKVDQQEEVGHSPEPLAEPQSEPVVEPEPELFAEPQSGPVVEPEPEPEPPIL
ncbi:MAG: hypothetical protein ACREX9_00050 [Gammaproteobacteria bacterium]